MWIWQGVPAIILSHSWGEKLGGTLKLDMTYATIPVFGQSRRLYWEMLMKYMVSSQEKPHNYPLHSVHTDLDSFILYNDGIIDSQVSHIENDYKKDNDSQIQT